MGARKGKSGFPSPRVVSKKPVPRIRSDKERDSSKARMRRLREDPEFRERENRKHRALHELGRLHATELERIVRRLEREQA